MEPITLPPRTLLLDLEVAMDGHIREAGAVLDGQSGFARQADAVGLLSRFVSGACCVLGHNLVAHDLVVLARHRPEHAILGLPVIDTLVLSPICFPENPYHRLVKDYKLVGESSSDPVADARLAGELFLDELRALAGMRTARPALFEVLHFLLGTSGSGDDAEDAACWDRQAEGMDLVFRHLGGIRPSLEGAMELGRTLLAANGCRNTPLDAFALCTPRGRLALAFVLAWLPVSGADSVLPPWVRLQHPDSVAWIERIRERPCGDPECGWCTEIHDPRRQLEQVFRFPDFRPVPANAAGGSLQRDIVAAGLRNESFLAILPTGGGKSLCFQLPALVRSRRRGSLTIVISPLQALMKDQVEGLARRTGLTSGAALYGMLTPPERADVLRRVRLGGVSILYVSPEQLRNRSFLSAIAQREIGCWVFDEAHCLSKWGHDFRPDYLYAGRFIRELALARGGAVPAIACFTATAKSEVRDEIVAHFRAETGRELAVFEGGVERTNLDFAVQPIASHGKLERLHDLLTVRLGVQGGGSAIVFHATRAATETSAAYLVQKGWAASHFHAGLEAPRKKDIQDAFLAGRTRVICATNAFGMGIDKDDVRLVIHADTPGSLENYLQEAGRAGRDGRRAECVLLFDEADCEEQFRMGAFSEISRRDIAQILRGLRKRAARGAQEEIVLTTGEILRDEDVVTGIDSEARSADTKVRTAIAWLERAGFLQRDENVTQVFQARPLVRNLEEARERIVKLGLPAAEEQLWIGILRELLMASVAEPVTVDQLATIPEFSAATRTGTAGGANPEYVSARIFKILGSMARVRLLQRDTLLTAFVRHKVPDHSTLRLERVVQAERAMLDELALAEPDPEGWMPLSLRLLNQRIVDRGVPCSAEMLRDLLRSVAEDGRGFAASHGSIELQICAHESYRLRVRRGWKAMGDLAEKRRRIAALALEVIFAKIPAEAARTADLLVPFSFEEIEQAIDRHPALRSEVKDMDAAIVRALLYLNEQHVIQLQRGLAIFRSAMTLRLKPERLGERYQTADYLPLAHHYRERILQVHVMAEYARQGLERIREAQALVLGYFTLEKEAFLRRFLGTRRELLEHATTAKSFERIVTSLDNPVQKRIVTSPVQGNLLILAGPGSGKTRTVVHRCAYLLRVERVPARSVLVCCFNRSAAIELRRRLVDLVGTDARGVIIQTYHGLAMRLLGRSAAARAETHGSEIDFDGLIADAVKLLKGEKVPPGIEADEVRDRLLAGFRHILVDEYQDIDAPQYELISAIAGRTLEDADQKLSIMAVGDDDQNIYSFRGANVQFIRQFQEDYRAEVQHLVENYRATRYLIEAANQVIEGNSDRMKTEQPIRIDRHRELLPPGGVFGARDPLTRGKVQVLRLSSPSDQPAAVIAEISRLRGLGANDASIAVLSSTHRDLARIRAAAELAGLPVCWQAGRQSTPPLHRIREVHRFLRALRVGFPGSVAGKPALPELRALVRASDLARLADALFAGDHDNPWVRFVDRQLKAWGIESGDAELPITAAREFFYEACADARREFDHGEGVVLSTVHAAKGSEFDHVLLVGSWPGRETVAEREEQRRAFYVGMTRARLSLAIFDGGAGESGPIGALGGSAVLFRPLPALTGEPLPSVAYDLLGQEDVHLGYPARFPEGHAVHRALATLRPGSRLVPRSRDNGGEEPVVELLDEQEVVVARLSRRGARAWRDKLPFVREVRVRAVARRDAEQEVDLVRRATFRVAEWEVPVVEIVTSRAGIR